MIFGTLLIRYQARRQSRDDTARRAMAKLADLMTMLIGRSVQTLDLRSLAGSCRDNDRDGVLRRVAG